MFRQWGAMLRESYSVAFVTNFILLNAFVRLYSDGKNMRGVSKVRDGKSLLVITPIPRISSRHPYADFSKVCKFLEALLPENCRAYLTVSRSSELKQVFVVLLMALNWEVWKCIGMIVYTVPLEPICWLESYAACMPRRNLPRVTSNCRVRRT